MNESIDLGMRLRPRRSVLSDISNRNQTNEIKGINDKFKCINIIIYSN